MLRADNHQMQKKIARLQETTTHKQVKIRQQSSSLSRQFVKINTLTTMLDEWKSRTEELEKHYTLSARTMVIPTFEQGRYNDNMRVVVYKLSTLGISSDVQGEAINTIIEGLTTSQLQRTPSVGSIKNMARETSTLAKIHLALEW